jgi:hypothetical protein
MTNGNRNEQQQQEIDIAELLRSVWAKRRFVLKVTALFVLVGLLAALFGQVKYTAVSVMVPQTGGEAAGGNLQGLAAMAGINLGGGDRGTGLSPTLYPMVVGSVPFQKELLHSTITVEGYDTPVVLLDYLTESEYQKFSLVGLLAKYTIGLPATIMNARNKGMAPPTLPDSAARADVNVLTPRENEARKLLPNLLTVSVDKQGGYITLTAVMPEALASAQVAARAQELLQASVVRFKVQKVQDDLDFIEARYREAQADFVAKQQARAAFHDANLNVTSAVAKTREERLSNEYNLALSIYSELARQREQALIKVKEDTPAFTVIEPVTVPMEKSAPRRVFILAVSLLLGLVAGMGLAVVGPIVRGVFGSRKEQE